MELIKHKFMTDVKEKPIVLKAPFPYFGGKSRVADVTWEALGDVKYYLEPFCGSAAVLLKRPSNHTGKHEIINDKDCMISNFWRSVKDDPSAVAKYADFPVSHLDQQARHKWLMQSPQALEMRVKLLDDPDFYDAKVAGYWVWGISCWIGSGWCTPQQTISTQIPHRTYQAGVNSCDGVYGVKVHGFECRPGLREWLYFLSDRLIHTIIMHGDWKRGFRSPYILKTNCGVFLDPPYSKEAKRCNNLYTEENLNVDHEVREWCIENEKVCRIVLAGYEGEHDELEQRGWSVLSWKARGGLESQGAEEAINCHRERLWFSPLCNLVEGAVPPPPDF